MNNMLKTRLSSQSVPEMPAVEQWEALIELKRRVPGKHEAQSGTIDIIIPVYRGIEETLACVFAAASTTLSDDCEIVVVNDGSPEVELVEALGRWSGFGLFTLLHNEENVGFVRTVNRAMALHEDRDVVLLNSDAIVHGDTWLARMKRAARSYTKVATVTPFSNNAEICSYPVFVANNMLQLELDDDELDALTARCNVSSYVKLPTGVGFCMFISRACLRAVGELDAKKFGKGYGEENDFCLRASSKGWTHLLAADVFVRHCGGVSFGEDKSRLVQNGLEVLARDWPDYGRLVQKFIETDPVFPFRRALDCARVENFAAERQTMLYVSHDWGGGVERHINDMRAMLRDCDVPLLVMREPLDRPGWIALEHSEVSQLPNLHFRIGAEDAELAAFLKKAGVFHVHVHSLAGYPVGACEWITRLAARLGVDYDFTAHDYLPMCPRITLIDGSGVYCGEPPENVCVECIATHGASVPVDSMRAHRERYVRFLGGARKIFAPSQDVKNRYEKCFPFLDVQIRPHPQGYSFSNPLPVTYRGEGVLRVAVIGAIGPHKGSGLLLECARDAENRELPIRWVLFGITDREELNRHPYVTVKGAYAEAGLNALLKEHRCHVAFFGSVWPETWSYTFSAALDAGLFPVAFDLGAIAERISSVGWGERIPTALMTQPSQVNDRMLAMRAGHFTTEVRNRIVAGAARYPHLLDDYYQLDERSVRIARANRCRTTI